MKEQKLFNGVTEVSDSIVDETAKEIPKRKRPVWQKAVAIAACATLLIAGGITIPKMILNSDITQYGAIVPVSYPKSYKYDDYDTEKKIKEDNQISQEAEKDIKDFAYETTASVFEGKNRNLNYSPLSLYYSLSMMASGANGSTKAELLELLNAKNNEELYETCGDLYRWLYNDNSIGKTVIASSLWANNAGFDINKSYAQKAAESFYATVHSVDFGKKSTLDKMNGWVAYHTKNTLKPNLILDSDLSLISMNTLYYYGEWAYKFDEKKTKSDIFTLSDGNKVSCYFVNNDYKNGDYYKGKNFIRTRLGLKDGSSMSFILPDEGTDPYTLLKTAESTQEALSGGERMSARIRWQIPKFSFDTSLDLKENLKKLGAKSAFSVDAADFSGISSKKIFVSKVDQDTCISLDEKGVTASAFTLLEYMGAGQNEEKSLDMRLTRPFIYVINSDNHIPLFIGVCNDPTAK